MSEKPILEILKDNWEGWKALVQLRRAAYDAAKHIVKKAEEDLKQAKHVLYITQKEWREAKTESGKAERKYKSFESSRRSWAKKNMGKVFEMMEENK